MEFLIRAPVSKECFPELRTFIVVDHDITKDRSDVIIQESNELGASVVAAEAASPVGDEVRIAIRSIGIVERGEGIGNLPGLSANTIRGDNAKDHKRGQEQP